MARIRREAPRRLNLALLAAVVLLGAAAGWMWTLRAGAQAREADEAAAVAAASTHAVSLISLDHRTFDTAFRRVLSTSTGETRARYESDQAEARKAVMRDKVLQTGVLRGAGLASMNPEGTSAQVLVVADVMIESTGRQGDKPVERFYRWRMHMAKQGGQWLVATAELVP